MTHDYQWTEDEDDIALDAITIGIRSDTRIWKVGGLQFGQRDAVIYWPDWKGKSAPISNGIEGPMAVPLALTRANELCARFEFERVVLWLQHRELWDERWGRLAAIPGL